jgi:hypothetical protein
VNVTLSDVDLTTIVEALDCYVKPVDAITSSELDQNTTLIPTSRAASRRELTSIRLAPS